MKSFQVNPIGTVQVRGEDLFLQLFPAYLPALQGLEGFSHINVIWWFSGFDKAEMREVLEVPQPYKRSPGTLGVFATRSPIRPNPVALTTCEALDIDPARGAIRIAYIDADDGTPILDIKPYTPSLDRVEAPAVPGWCGHWPKCLEESGGFNWEDEFNF